MIPSLKRFIGHPGFTLPVSAALIALSGVLVFVHAVTIRQVKEVGLPAALTLPQMEQRLMLLKDQVEASQLQETMRSGSAQEQLHVHVLPANIDLERLLATFDILHDALRQDALLFSMSPIQVGEPSPLPGHDGLRGVPVSFEAEVSQEGMDKLLLLLRLSGDLTVSDALNPGELTALINLTEQENPAALTVLEQFLGTDLLRYSRESASYENQVLRSLTSETFEAQFRQIVDHSALAKAKYLYGGSIGTLLERHNLWPAQMLGIEHLDVTPLAGGHFRLSLALQAFVRSAS
jgi:hypothetical protein